ncbi:MAG TPA: DNA polymerase Y family protein, partial [Puia sp.]|nr:DNA polymerase Y family protein [Puia sp.]
MDGAKRYCSIWFPDLLTDQVSAARPELRERPLVLTIPDRGKKLITAANHAARLEGIQNGMVVADARVLCPTLEIVDERPAQAAKLLRSIAIWTTWYTPVSAIDAPDGLLADITGCAHLWGGEGPYLQDIRCRLKAKGYTVRCAIADTVGAAWAVSRFGSAGIIPPGEHPTTLLPYSLAALRIDNELLGKLERLGLRTIGQIAGMPRRALERRCGSGLLHRLDQATGIETELLQPVVPVFPFQERLPCLEPICTAAGIAIALRNLLDTICSRLQEQGKGLRLALFKGYRLDGKVVSVQIGTNRGSNNPAHLFKLFEEKICLLEPDPGIELFILEAPKV